MAPANLRLHHWPYQRPWAPTSRGGGPSFAPPSAGPKDTGSLEIWGKSPLSEVRCTGFLAACAVPSTVLRHTSKPLFVYL